MTISLIRGGGERLTLRYIPALAWAFIGLTAYGAGTIIAAVAAGARAMDGGTIIGLASLLAIILFAALTAGQLVACTFDRAGDELRIVRYGLLGRAVQARPLSDVVGLDVRVLRRAQHRIELRLRSGERLPLTPYYVVAFGMGGVERLSAIIGVAPVVVQTQASLRR